MGEGKYDCVGCRREAGRGAGLTRRGQAGGSDLDGIRRAELGR